MKELKHDTAGNTPEPQLFRTKPTEKWAMRFTGMNQRAIVEGFGFGLNDPHPFTLMECGHKRSSWRMECTICGLVMMQEVGRDKERHRHGGRASEIGFCCECKPGKAKVETVAPSPATKDTPEKCNRCGLSLSSYERVVNIRQGVGYHVPRDGDGPQIRCETSMSCLTCGHIKDKAIVHEPSGAYVCMDCREKLNSADTPPIEPRTTLSTTRDWVRCPICGQPDMRQETDSEGNAIISCVNLACASNGGSNTSGLSLKSHGAAYDAGAKSISQGPAREETLEKIITDILKLHGHPVTHNSKALARELFDAGAQSRTPTNLESRTEPDDLRIWAHTESLRADVAEARLKDLESRTAPDAQWYKDHPISAELLRRERGAALPKPNLESRTVAPQPINLGFAHEDSGETITRLDGRLAKAEARIQELLAGAAALPSSDWVDWPKGVWVNLPEGTNAQCAKCKQMTSVGYWNVAGCNFCKECFKNADPEWSVEDLGKKLAQELRRRCDTRLSLLHQSAWYEAANELEKFAALVLAASVPAASSPTKESQEWVRDAAAEIDQYGQDNGFCSKESAMGIIAKHYAASSPEPNQGDK